MKGKNWPILKWVVLILRCEHYNTTNGHFTKEIMTLLNCFMASLTKWVCTLFDTMNVQDLEPWLAVILSTFFSKVYCASTITYIIACLLVFQELKVQFSQVFISDSPWLRAEKNKRPMGQCFADLFKYQENVYMSTFNAVEYWVW